LILGELVAGYESNIWGLDITQPILYNLRPYIIRRTKDSKDLFGDSVVELPPVQLLTHSVRLNKYEQSAYDNWADMEAKSKNPKAQNFQILARKYCLDPHHATTGWFDP
jgi:SNF2 family DNA or RNA helicase